MAIGAGDLMPALRRQSYIVKYSKLAPAKKAFSKLFLLFLLNVILFADIMMA